MFAPAFVAACVVRLESRQMSSSVSFRPFHSATKMVVGEISNTRRTYNKLCDRVREISQLEGLMGQLEWDEKVMMSEGSAEARGNQKAALVGCIHEKRTAEELGQIIEEVERGGTNELDQWEKANVRDAKRSYQMAVGVKKELAERIVKLATEGHQVWVKARKENRFEDFAPVLQRLVHVKKEYAKATRPDMDPYDGCIDMYERGMTAKRLDEIFGALREPLKGLLDKILAAEKPRVPKLFDGGDEWDPDGQEKASKEIARILGFDFTRGRLDKSVHPFTQRSHPNDVRMTSRYSKEVPFEGIMGVVHECGHAMYEQGRNLKYDSLPVSESLSHGLHESQSLLWERCVGQSAAFWNNVTPLFHNHLPGTKGATPKDFYLALNRVSPSLIRVDADEVTYPFHIMLRFEIEKRLMDGSLQSKDLPRIWNSKVKEYLGIDVPSDTKGVLQDIHWSEGDFGYFPSYCLGALTASQIYETAKSKIPDLENELTKGESGYRILRKWLNQNVHEFGSLYTNLDDMLEAVTGEALTPKYFLNYLTEKYGRIYSF